MENNQFKGSISVEEVEKILGNLVTPLEDGNVQVRPVFQLLLNPEDPSVVELRDEILSMAALQVIFGKDAEFQMSAKELSNKFRALVGVNVLVAPSVVGLTMRNQETNEEKEVQGVLLELFPIASGKIVTAYYDEKSAYVEVDKVDVMSPDEVAEVIKRVMAV